MVEASSVVEAAQLPRSGLVQSLRADISVKKADSPLSQ
jgi:hypothetical protein